jgi:hypothetical protein
MMATNQQLLKSLGSRRLVFSWDGDWDERYGLEIEFEWDVKPILATDVIRFLTSLDLVVRESVYDVLDAVDIGAEIRLREESRKGQVHELRITRLETGSIKGVVLGLLIKLLREFCDTVEVARAMFPNGVKDLVQKD